jgi:hypothetical protein
MRGDNAEARTELAGVAATDREKRRSDTTRANSTNAGRPRIRGVDGRVSAENLNRDISVRDEHADRKQLCVGSFDHLLCLAGREPRLRDRRRTARARKDPYDHIGAQEAENECARALRRVPHGDVRRTAHMRKSQCGHGYAHDVAALHHDNAAVIAAERWEKRIKRLGCAGRQQKRDRTSVCSFTAWQKTDPTTHRR